MKNMINEKSVRQIYSTVPIRQKEKRPREAKQREIEKPRAKVFKVMVPYLKQCGVVSRGEVIKATGLSAYCVRKTLDYLVSKGEVKKEFVGYFNSYKSYSYEWIGE